MEPGLNFGKDQNCPAIRTSCRSSSFSPKTHSTATHPRGEPYWSMAHKWAAAVMAGDGSKLSQLILSSSTTPAAALSVARSCVTLLEKGQSERQVILQNLEVTSLIMGSSLSSMQGKCAVCYGDN